MEYIKGAHCHNGVNSTLPRQICDKLMTTYPVSAGYDDDLKNSIIDGVKTFGVTIWISRFLLKRKKGL
jgi:hypothetical protein